MFINFAYELPLYSLDISTYYDAYKVFFSKLSKNFCKEAATDRLFKALMYTFV